jgi:hypothetical protein
MHLLTSEALQVYRRVLAPGGLLLLHISNRYIELAPVVGANAEANGLRALSREDRPSDESRYAPSRWIALSAKASVLDGLARARSDAPWTVLEERASHPWTDDHASILPYVRWSRMTGNP